jgi:8-oxo-dGTP pyrophosphatase MutT (NUDIX family)
VTASTDDAVIPAGGGVVWRTRDDGAVETAVIHRPKYDDWSLPKGKLDAGEHVLQAAVREVGEETGLTVVTGRRSVSTRYPVPEGVKHVDYWLMRAVGGEFEPNREVDELRWVSVGDACTLLSHDHDRDVVADLDQPDVPREPALLLVRHGRAGKRDDWAGPDDLRPLDEKGRSQAERLAEVLPLFAPTAVLSVPRVRCTQTVEPLADRLGLPVLPCPELGEEEFDADPQAGLAVVERLMQPRDTPGVTVVCSQGGAIPSALMALGVRPDGVAGKLWPPAAKGSTWALGGRPGALAADYYRDFAGSALGSQDGRDAS